MGTLQCLVSARMITQPLQAGNWIAFPMLAREEQGRLEVAAQGTAALWWGWGSWAEGGRQHNPRRGVGMVPPVSLIVTD